MIWRIHSNWEIKTKCATAGRKAKYTMGYALCFNIWCDHYLLTLYAIWIEGPYSNRNDWLRRTDIGRYVHTQSATLYANSSNQQPKRKQYEKWLLKLCRKGKLITQYNGKFVPFDFSFSRSSALTFAKRIHAELTNSHSKQIYSWRCDFIFLSALWKLAYFMAQKNIHFVSRCFRKRQEWKRKSQTTESIRNKMNRERMANCP